jgi:hypothetical protein
MQLFWLWPFFRDRILRERAPGRCHAITLVLNISIKSITSRIHYRCANNYTIFNASDVKILKRNSEIPGILKI